MLAERKQKYPNAIYLSLNHTLGGAFCIDGKLFRGQNQKAGEFGHMILVPGGRKCYCGKSGCADAYCAASVLTQDNRQSLDAFMEKIESGDEKILQTWNEYLDYLAVLISNLRMAYDMDIIPVSYTHLDVYKRQTFPVAGSSAPVLGNLNPFL